MAEPPNLEDLPQATVAPRKRARISIIWIIPILAALVAIGIAVQRYLSEGPTITIVFSAAEGIEAGKTFVKYKDVIIGRVTKVELTKGFSKVEVTVKVNKYAAPLMVDDAKFWVVRPSISLSGISGLNTLLSGNYIGFEPGVADASQDTYVGLDEAPPVITLQRGRQFSLTAGDLGSLEVGSPIYYRRLVFFAWFNAGVRAVDIRDPFHPREVASYVPATTPQTDRRCVKCTPSRWLP